MNPDCSKTEETLKNSQVTPEDIDNGYTPGIRVYDDYKDIMAYARKSKNNTPGNFAHDRGISRTKNRGEYAKLVHRFGYWAKKGNPPKPIVAILALHEMGIFPASPDACQQDALSRLIYDELLPFNYNNDYFQIISLLSSLGFWRGGGYSINKQSGVEFQLRKVHDDKLLQQIIKFLTGRNPSSSSTLKINLDAIRARLLRAINPIGHKGETQLAYPRQIELAIASLEDAFSSKKEIEAARKVIYDFILSFFYVGKCTYSKTRNLSGILPYSQHKHIADRRARLFRKAVEYSELGFSTRIQTSSQLGGRGREIMTYSHHVFFDGITGSDIADLQEQFRQRASMSALL